MKKIAILVGSLLTTGCLCAQESANEMVAADSFTASDPSSVAIDTTQQNVYTLEDIRKMALDNNKSNKKAQAEKEQASYERKAARTKYFPDLSIKGGYVRNGDDLTLASENLFLPIGTLGADGSFSLTPNQVSNNWTLVNGQAVPLDANGQPFNPKTNPEKLQWKQYTTIPKDELSFDTKNIFVAALNLVQPVFMGGKIVAYNKICKLKMELADSKQSTLQDDIIVNADATYWQIVSLNSKKKAVEGLITLLDKMEKDVDHLIESGMATKADQLSVSVKKNEAEMALFKVENGIHLSKMLLAQYCGLPLNESYKLADEDIDAIEVSKTEPADMESVYEKRSEIKSLTIAEEINNQKEHVERAKLMPNIALFGSYAGTSPNLKDGFDKGMGWDWHVGVIVNIPLLHWGENIYTLKAAKCESQIAKYNEEEAKEKIELQVTQSQFNHDEALRKLDISTRSLEKAEENLKHATLGFNAGVIPASNLMEAQTAWLSAKSNKIEAEIEAKVSEINYKKAIGTLKDN